MPIIDESVVKISLDDSNFDKASDKTIDKLDELKKSLHFDGAVESFKEIEKAAKHTDLSPLEKGVTAVSIQFDALYTIADTTFRRIINGGLDAAEKTLKSLTVDNITSGWDKYADKTSAVQTIMASTANQFENTGEQMKYVENQLDKLNWFTDETSYAFLDMVNNIGKFTSNNIALDKAATAMQGISTWAAISGAGINGASHAMYNLAQAIGLGAVTLMDWKSIELANMGTVEFKQMAMEVAAADKQLVKLNDNLYQTAKGTKVTVETFRDTLSEKWFTSDVLIDVLNMYGGFADSLYQLAEITDMSATPLIRYVNEYKEGTLDLKEAMTATGLSAAELTEWLDKLSADEMDLGRRAFAAAQEAKTFAEALDATKEAVSTGWMNTFEIIFGNYEEAKELWSDLAEGLYDVFVESGNVRNGLLRAWKELGGREDLIDGIRIALGNLVEVTKFLKETFEGIFPPKTAEELFNMTKGFYNLMESLTIGEETIRNIQNIINPFLISLEKLGQVGIIVFAALEPIWILLGELSGAIVALFGNIGKLISIGLDKVISPENLLGLYDLIYSISSIIAEFLTGSFRQLFSILESLGGFLWDIASTFQANGGGLSGLISAIASNIDLLIGRLLSGESEINRVLGNIFDIFLNIINGILSLIKKLVGIENTDNKNPILVLFEWIHSFLEKTGLLTALESIANAFSTFIDRIAASINGANDIGNDIHALVSFIIDDFGILLNWLINGFKDVTVRDIALLILLIQMSTMLTNITNSFRGIGSSISGVFDSFRDVIDNLGNGFKPFSNSVNNFIKNTKYLQIAIAIGVLGDAFVKLSQIPVEQLAVSTVAMGAVMGMIVLLMESMKKLSGDSSGADEALKAAANNLIQIAAGIGILAMSTSLLGGLDLLQIGKGLLGVGGIMLEIIGFLFLFKKVEGSAGTIAKVSLSLVALATALTMMSIPIGLIGSFDVDTIIKGLSAIALILISFASAAALLKNVKVVELMSVAAALDIMAVGIAAISIPIFLLGQLDITSLIGGLVSVIALFGSFSLIASLLSDNVNPTSLLLAASAIDIMAAGILALSIPVFALSQLDLSSIGKGLLALGGILVEIVGFVFLLQTVQGSSLELIAIATSLGIFATGLTIMAAAIAIIGQLDLDDIGKGLLAVVGLIGTLTAASVILNKVGGSGGSVALFAISSALISFSGSVLILATAIKTIDSVKPETVAYGIGLMVAAFASFAGLAWLCTILSQGLMTLATTIVIAGAGFAAFAVGITLLFNVLKQGIEIIAMIMMAGAILGDELPQKISEAMDVLQLIIRKFLQMIPELAIDIGIAVASIIVAIQHAMLAKIPATINVVLIFLNAILQTLIQFAGPLIDGLAQLIEELIPGIPKLLAALGKFIEEFIAGAFSLIWSAIVGLIRGIFGSVGLSYIGDIIGQALNDGGKSIIDGIKGFFTNIGRNTSDGMKEGLEEGLDDVSKAGENLGRTAVESTREAAGVNSPSWITTWIGSMVGEGVVEGVNGTLSDVENSGFSMMSSFFGGVNNAAEAGGKKTSNILDSILQMVGVKTAKINDAVKLSEESALRAQIKEGKILGYDVSDLEKQLANLNKTSAKTSAVVADTSASIAKNADSTAKSAKSASSSAAKTQTAAEKIIDSYKEMLNELDYLDKKHKAEYNLWEALNPDMTELEKNSNKLELVNKEIETQLKRTEVAQEKYEKISKEMGKSSEEARDAEVEWIEQQVTLAKLQNEAIETQNAIIANASKQLELQEKNAELSYNLWSVTNQNASQVEQQQKKLEYTMAKLEYSSNKVAEATNAYNEALEKYGEEASETKELLNELLQAQIDYAEIEKDILDIQENMQETEKELAELRLSNASLEYEIWEQMNKNASAAEKEAKKTEEVMNRYEKKMKDLKEATEDYKKACEEFGEESIEAAQAYENMLKLQKESLEIYAELANNQKDYIESLTNELAISLKRYELEDELWEATNENATSAEKHKRNILTATRNLVYAQQDLFNYEKKYALLLKEEGETSQNTQQAYQDILSQKIKIAECEAKIKDLDMESLEIAMKDLEFEEKRLSISDSIWSAQNKGASEALKYAHNIEKINYQMVLSMKELNNLSEQYNKQIERYGQNSEQARAAWESYRNKQIELLELQNERKAIELDIIENELSMISLAQSRAKTEYEIWEALNQDVTDSNKKTREITYQMQSLEFATEKLRTASKKYNYALKVYGEDAKETQQLFNEMLDAQLDYVNTYNKLKTAQQEILEKNNEILEQLEYSEKLLSYGYNMWEKLYDDVSDAQKIEAEIKKLNQSLSLQVQRANYYGAEWKKAVAKYGQSSAEAQQAYLDYLEALYNALDIQSSIASKEEDLTKWREENAQRLKDAWAEVMEKDLVGGTSIYDELVEMGMTEAEIEAYVKERAGYIEEAIDTEMDFTIENMQKKAEDALREWGLTWVDGTYDAAEGVIENVGNCMGEMTDIIAEGAAEGNALAEEAIADIERMVEEGAEETTNTTEAGMDSIVDAIETGGKNVVSAMEQVVDEALHNVTYGKTQEMVEVGHWLVMGIGQGIIQNKWSVIDPMIQVVEEAIWWANHTAQIRSPSRRTMWSGEMLDAGFIKGIENRAGEIAKTMASAVQNGIDAINKIVHTSNTMDFASGLISNGILGGFEGYYYNVLSIGNEVLQALSDEYDDMIDEMAGDNLWLLDALRDYGFDETTHGIEFVVNLNADEARTELENLFAQRESDLEYYDDLLEMQKRNAAKDQSDLYVRAEAQAIAREINRILSSIESAEHTIEDIVNAGRVSDSDNSIYGKKLEYIQNIYSSKPLSTLDIYRNTNSQLLKFTTWRR